MVLQPKVLILDEPTSQLDPIAASDFLATLGKINRELGTTDPSDRTPLWKKRSRLPRAWPSWTAASSFAPARPPKWARN